MALKLVTAAAPIVSLTEAKRHVHAEDFQDDDTYLEALVATATEHIDGKAGWLGRALGTQTWDFVMDDFPCGSGPLGGGIRIPLPPLQSVTSVVYADRDTGLDVTLVENDDYEVDTYGEPGWVMPSDDGWPAPMETINAVRIRFVAGYTTTPKPIKHAILLLVGDWYKNRENSTEIKLTEMPRAVDALLMPYRIWG